MMGGKNQSTKQTREGESEIYNSISVVTFNDEPSWSLKSSWFINTVIVTGSVMGWNMQPVMDEMLLAPTKTASRTF